MSFFRKKSDIDITLEEIKSLAKKEGKDFNSVLNTLLPKTPTFAGVDFYRGFLVDLYKCPTCAASVGDEMLTFPYCPHCGQRLFK